MQRRPNRVAKDILRGDEVAQRLSEIDCESVAGF